MSTGGFSKSRLGRLHDLMARYVERRELAGVVTLVGLRGDVHVDTIGRRAVDNGDSMRRDTIFRITSMTKPIAAAATMILVEECKLRLDEPVDRLLPELANRRVLQRLDGPLDDTVTARRPITVRDLLTMRTGFGIIMAPPDMYPIQRAVSELKLMTLGPPTPPTLLVPDEWIRRFGTLPLMHQPGEKWMYNSSFHVLSVLIARATGRPFDAFLKERLFDPLGMKDTGFTVPSGKLDRFASSYQFNPETKALALFDGVKDSQWLHPPKFPDGAGGLVSTVDDYLAFSRMLLNKGKHGSTRILSRHSVEAMTTDQITPEQKAASPFYPGFWDSHGYGFGVSVVTRRDGVSSAPGRFGWDGGYGTSWFADPREEMTGILMTQRHWTSATPPDFVQDFLTLAYQVIDD